MRKFIRISFWIMLFLVGGLYVVSHVSCSVTKTLDTYIYELPFAPGTKHKVIQGYGGLFSHNHIAALDFEMPVGTPVYAAREGVIFSYRSDSDEGGPFPSYQRKANYIIIKHSDGSFGCYWHLKKDGVVVTNGQVAKGQLIGYSGRTGFTFRAHLHFSVKRILNYDKDSFVRTKFRTSDGVELLERGKYYERPE